MGELRALVADREQEMLEKDAIHEDQVRQLQANMVTAKGEYDRMVAVAHKWQHRAIARRSVGDMSLAGIVTRLRDRAKALESEHGALGRKVCDGRGVAGFGFPSSNGRSRCTW